MISDGRFSAEKVLPFADERFHLVHLMHNVHLHGQREWNAPLSPAYVFLLSLISDLDGLVSLTSRQRADIAERFGPTNNLFAVANPVVLPTRPEPLPERERARFTMVTRFDLQKRLDHAIHVFQLVVSERPQAQLLIYGDGDTASSVRSLIDELELQDNVLMCGWDPDARDTLWTSTGFLLTSAHEGYPLATLESMSRGCPVISYDIKYGPREQISSGVDGFLVPDADQRAMADRIVAMIDDADLVRSLSSAALESVQQHDYRAFPAGLAGRAHRGRRQQATPDPAVPRGPPGVPARLRSGATSGPLGLPHRAPAASVPADGPRGGTRRSRPLAWRRLEGRSADVSTRSPTPARR